MSASSRPGSIAHDNGILEQESPVDVQEPRIRHTTYGTPLLDAEDEDDIDGDVIEAEKQGQIPQSKWGSIARREFKGRAGTACISPSGSVCITLSAPAAYRLQLRTRSCDIWFPQKLVPGIEAAFGFMIQHMHTCPALTVALDAASLCHLGQEFGDMRLSKAGFHLHNKSLQLLRRELTATADRQNRALVAAILTLQITEAFASLECDASGWMHHSRGMTAILDNLGAEPHPQGYSELISCSFHLFHFWSGVAERKRIRAFNGDGGTLLYSITERIPEALEISDAACEKGAMLHPDQAQQVMSLLSTIEQELNEWTSAWNPCMRTAPFHIVDSKKLFIYQSPNGKRAKNPFPLSMEFRTCVDALDHIMCTAGLLVVREAMIDVCKTLSKATPEVNAILGKKVSSLKAAAHSCADSLCMAIPYFLLPSTGQYGFVLASHPLRVASRWYTRVQQEFHDPASEKLQWCAQVAGRIEQRGIRPL